mmetsp:Transcript_4411/g.15338  ORF Transcript_4411/g.15338 Transcript_4411/m.15338 type:complete len:224 (+) Transcript_4411:745-1416(+)
MIAVLSTLPERSMSPALFHLSEKMGPVCFTSVFFSSPSVPQMRAWPSYDPVASKLPSPFQSNVVTSLLFDLSCMSLTCRNTTGSVHDAAFAPPRSPTGPDGNVQMRAVESPDPDARSELAGLHAHMNTSDWCPFSTATLSSAITIGGPAPSSSIGTGPFRSAASERCLLTSRTLRSASSSRRCLTRSFRSSMSLVRSSCDASRANSPSTSDPLALRFASSSRY